MSVTDIAAFAVRPLSEVAGAEITGVDLSQPPSPGLVDAIMAAFLAHRLLVFRERRLTEDQPSEPHRARGGSGDTHPPSRRTPCR